MRGPVVATTRHPMQRNAIGAHSGSYCIYKVVVATGVSLVPFTISILLLCALLCCLLSEDLIREDAVAYVAAAWCFVFTAVCVFARGNEASTFFC